MHAKKFENAIAIDISQVREVAGRLSTDIDRAGHRRTNGLVRRWIQRVRDGQARQVQRAEPSGDVVAQYTDLPMDPRVAMSLSNSFAGEITGVVGQERTDMLLPGAWRELRNDLAPSEAQTMTIRRTITDGQPDLTCEVRYGSHVYLSHVRYGNYPSSWFLSTFPGGWADLAKRENFELPAKFQQH